MPSIDTAPPPPARGWARWVRAFNGFNDNHQSIHAGHIAFVALLSLFPFLIVLVSVAGLIGSIEAAAEFLDMAMDQMPADVAAALGPVASEIVDAPRRGVLTIGLGAALWAASTGFEALRYAFNQAYGAQQLRQLWWRRLQSLGLTILFALVVIFTTFSMVIVPRLVAVGAALLNRPDAAVPIVPWFGPLIAFVVLVVMTAALFQVLPRARPRWLEVLPGAVFTVVGWIVCAQLFNLYLVHVAAYSITYGSLGGVVATLMFFYIAAAVLLFGCELNAAGHRPRA